jgi:hypothetical protein
MKRLFVRFDVKMISQENIGYDTDNCTHRFLCSWSYLLLVLNELRTCFLLSSFAICDVEEIVCQFGVEFVTLVVTND